MTLINAACNMQHLILKEDQLTETKWVHPGEFRKWEDVGRAETRNLVNTLAMHFKEKAPNLLGMQICTPVPNVPHRT
ncbi:hypothetical protein L596_005983 [Steinernema carpocapsae]|uniref:Uncharacterized protein n=1 Tax=Steinernema carpocapsae TaxID=34508 RepID=A0A4U8V5S4_STECR|nr:hypothetical protein L596_005983 [Steinernema carpocapsae]